MLDDPLNLNYGYLLYNHPLVSSMQNTGENRPAQYLESGIFADALIDIIGQQADIGLPVGKMPKTNEDNNKFDPLKRFAEGLLQMKSSPMQKMLLSQLSKSDDSYKKLKKSLEEWYESNMDRASGWYKRKQKKSLWWFGLIIAIFLNVDSIHLFKVISMDSELRNNLVLVAEGVAKNYEQLTPKQKLDTKRQIALLKTSVNNLNKITKDRAVVARIEKTQLMIKDLQQQLKLTDSVSKAHLEQTNEILDISSQLALPIGLATNVAPISWFTCEGSQKPVPTNSLGKYLYGRNYHPGCKGIFLWFLGLLISSLALSFGAPFWFDLLVKFVNIRKAGLKPLNKTKTAQS